mmetsp:Transcript_108676/g.346444  ORF Transcript_108676/g.346444 Transcript_108676/m.346444 type:complete len:523 (-) Transcript_108676:125-1693(-)
MGPGLVVQELRRQQRPVHLRCHLCDLCEANAWTAPELLQDRLAELLVGEAPGVLDLLARPVEQHFVLRVPHPLANTDRQQVMEPLRQPRSDAWDTTLLQLRDRKRDVVWLLPELDADAEVAAGVDEALRLHRLRKEVPAEDRGVQQRLDSLRLVLELRCVDAGGDRVAKVVLDEPQRLLGADIALVIPLQRVAEHGWRIAVSYAVDGLGALGHALHELDLPGGDDPATVALGDEVERRVVLVGNPVVLRAAQEEQVLNAVGGRVDRQVQSNAVVPAPDHLLGLLPALQVRHVQDPQLVVDRVDGEDLEDAPCAEAREQPPAAGHRERVVGALVQPQVPGLVAVHSQHGSLGSAHDDLDVRRALVGRGQHAEAEGLPLDPEACTAVACVAGLCHGGVHEEAETLGEQCDPVRPQRSERGAPLFLDALLHCEDVQRLTLYREGAHDARLEYADQVLLGAPAHGEEAGVGPWRGSNRPAARRPRLELRPQAAPDCLEDLLIPDGRHWPAKGCPRDDRHVQPVGLI